MMVHVIICPSRACFVFLIQNNGLCCFCDVHPGHLPVRLNSTYLHDLSLNLHTEASLCPLILF